MLMNVIPSSDRNNYGAVPQSHYYYDTGGRGSGGWSGASFAAEGGSGGVVGLEEALIEDTARRCTWKADGVFISRPF
jgi:hypothetical protein